MKPNVHALLMALSVTLLFAEPALAQSIDLSPIQSLLQGIVDALTEPPRVYRRVCGSKIRLLFRQRSSLRRMPPLLRLA